MSEQTEQPTDPTQPDPPIGQQLVAWLAERNAGIAIRAQLADGTLVAPENFLLNMPVRLVWDVVPLKQP